MRLCWQRQWAQRFSGKHMSSLGKDIRGKAPSKKQINLIVTEKTRGNAGKVIGTVFLVAVILAAAGLYIINERNTADSLQGRLWAAQDELLLLQAKSSEFDEVGEDYVRYSFAHLTGDEKNSLTGMMIIKKIEELVVPYGFVTEMAIDGNSVDFTVYSEDIGDVTTSLRSDPMVKSVTPRSESKQESAATITVTENVSAMIMKTVGGVQVVKRSDDELKKETDDVPEDGEDAEETYEEDEDISEDKKNADSGNAEFVNTEKLLEDGNKNVQVTIVIPPVMSKAQLKVTFYNLEGN